MLTEKTAAHSVAVFPCKGCRILQKLIFLTDAFFQAYASCSELEKKATRPYVRIGVILGGVLWAVPLRSHITHSYVIWTDREHQCGIDFTKAVAVSNPELYISTARPRLRPNEFEQLKRINQHTLEQKLLQYMRVYRRAKVAPDAPHNAALLRYSTLQYFEDYMTELE